MNARLDLEADIAELVCEVGDDILGAGVCPDDGTTERLAGLATPCDSGLALVCDAYRRAASLSHDCWYRSEERLTDDFHAVLRPSSSLQVLAGFGDTNVATLHDLVCILFMPAGNDRVSHRGAPVKKNGLTQARDSTAGIRFGVAR